MSRRLEGQTAWVSGAASGIGAATARLFAEEGANVAVVDVLEDSAAAVRDSIGGRAIALGADVSDEGQVRASIAETARRFGGLRLREHLDKTPDPAATLAGRLRRVPMRSALTPGDVARAILYLSCEDSAGVTGTSLVVDGGYLAAAEWDAHAEDDR
jgi:NAD(P)-dependent dehydrogenase (short-subunit alcohol dehydrogenase family)